MMLLIVLTNCLSILSLIFIGCICKCFVVNFFNHHRGGGQERGSKKARISRLKKYKIQAKWDNLYVIDYVMHSKYNSPNNLHFTLTIYFIKNFSLQEKKNHYNLSIDS